MYLLKKPSIYLKKMSLNTIPRYLLTFTLFVILSAGIHNYIKPNMWLIYTVHLGFLLMLMFSYFIIPKDKRSEYLLGFVSLKFLGYLIYAFVLSRFYPSAPERATIFLHFFVSYGLCSLCFFGLLINFSKKF